MKKTARKRRAPWIDFTFSVVIFALVVTGGFAIFNSVKDSKRNDFVASASTISDSHYKGIKISSEISNDSYAPFAVQYPQSAYHEFNEEVSTYIQQAKDYYLEEMANLKEAGQTTPGELNISFETIPHHSGNYTFVLLSTTYTGGANGMTDIQSFHLHPESGESLSIEEVFESDVKRLDTVSEIVKDLLYADSSLKDYLFPDEVNIHTAPKWDNFRNFAITEDKLIFYFSKYEIAAGAAGIPIAVVPLEQINDIVAADFKLKKEEDKADNATTQPADENDGSNKNDATTEETPENKDKSNTNEGDKTPPVKRVALTFDDGPHPKVTPQILDTLHKYDAKATFFMLGSRAEYYPEIAKQVNDAGHELGNHTWTHPDLTKSNVEKVRNEINRTTSIIESVTGEKVTAFRPPYGAVNDTVRGQTDLPIVLWDVDTLDWQHRDASKLLAYVKKQTKDGSIILMHDIHQSTADGLDAVLNYLQAEGYSFVTVSELQ